MERRSFIFPSFPLFSPVSPWFASSHGFPRYPAPLLFFSFALVLQDFGNHSALEGCPPLSKNFSPNVAELERMGSPVAPPQSTPMVDARGIDGDKSVSGPTNAANYEWPARTPSR